MPYTPYQVFIPSRDRYMHYLGLHLVFSRSWVVPDYGLPHFFNFSIRSANKATLCQWSLPNSIVSTMLLAVEGPTSRSFLVQPLAFEEGVRGVVLFGILVLRCRTLNLLHLCCIRLKNSLRQQLTSPLPRPIRCAILRKVWPSTFPQSDSPNVLALAYSQLSSFFLRLHFYFHSYFLRSDQRIYKDYPRNHQHRQFGNLLLSAFFLKQRVSPDHVSIHIIM